MVARRQEWSHGTVFGYDKRGCRCDPCRLARRDYDQRRYVRVRDKRIEQSRAWRAANPDKMRSYSRAQYHRDPKKAQAAAMAWRAKNPEASDALSLRYRQSKGGRLAAARKAALRRGVVTDEWTDDYITMLLDDPCSYCGGVGGTIDHIVPIKAGGTSEWDNLTAACRSCNASKRDITLIGFLSRKAS